MRKIVTLVLLFFIVGIISNTYAIELETVFKDDTQEEPMLVIQPPDIPDGGGSSTVKVYIDGTIKDYLVSQNRPVYSETALGETLYYYYDSKYISNGVSTRSWNNNIEQVVYMIRQIESYAKDNPQPPTLLGIPTNADTTLNYLRTINRNYESDYKGSWALLAGETQSNFINTVNSLDTHDIRINEYFANYLSRNSYNTTHGEIDDPHVNYDNYLDDPVNLSYTVNDKIDLIHMFAAIDGMYKVTLSAIALTDNFQKDITGWVGDLQTFVRFNLYKTNFPENKLKAFVDTSNGYSNMPIDFGDYLSDSNNQITANRMSNADVLADIDATNITVHFLNNYNSLSQSIVSYYRLINSDNSQKMNRYKLFIESITSETSSNHQDSIESFKHEVYKSMFLDNNGNGFSGPIGSLQLEYHL